MKYAILVTDDHSAACTAFEQVMGQAPAVRDGDRWAEFKCADGTRLAIAAPDEAGVSAPTMLPAFESDDLDTDVARLNAAGFEAAARRDMGAHGRSVLFRGAHGAFQLFARSQSASETGTAGQPENFRLAMRRFASSVSIIATAVDTRRFAMTATAVTSVSMNPPTILVCVNRNARIHKVLKHGRPFSVNVLSGSQQALSDRCSREETESRFAGGDWGILEDGTPYLDGAQAVVHCDVTNLIQHGTHSIVLGRVRHATFSSHIDPLVYLDGRYVSIGSP